MKTNEILIVILLVLFLFILSVLFQQYHIKNSVYEGYRCGCCKRNNGHRRRSGSGVWVIDDTAS